MKVTFSDCPPIQKVSESLLRHYTLPNSSACAARTFAKVLIARRATTFGKADYLESQLLLEYVV